MNITETIDEFHDVIQAFVESDPDGNVTCTGAEEPCKNALKPMVAWYALRSVRRGYNG